MMDNSVILFGSFSEDESLSYQQPVKPAKAPQPKPTPKKAESVKNIPVTTKAPTEAGKGLLETPKPSPSSPRPLNGVKHIQNPASPQKVVHAVTPIKTVTNLLDRATIAPEKQRDRDPAAAAAASKPVPKSWASLVQPAAVIPRGLVNTGNSCYLNSTLQALMSCPPFWQFLLTLKAQGRTLSAKDFPALYGFVQLAREFEDDSSSNNLYPKGDQAADAVIKDVQTGSALVPAMFDPLIRVFRPDLPGRQEDVPDFLCYLLDNMHTELIKLHGGAASDATVSIDDGWQAVGPKNRTSRLVTCSRGWSPLNDIFGGQLSSITKSKGIMLEPFFVLMLDINLGIVSTVEQALAHGPRMAVLPKVLILQLLRFGFENSSTRKIAKAIDFSERLTLNKDLVPLGCEVTRYELIATIMHHGRDFASGHYTADTKRNDSWLRFDDRMVNRVSVDTVLNKQAYVLFYQRL